MTDVLASDNGVEQRRGLRLTPRRSFEATFNPSRNERTFLDLWLHNLASGLCYFPLWHDQARLTQAIDPGDTQIPIDNTYREFLTGGLAYITDGSAFNYELVEINYQDSTTLFIKGVVHKSWKRGMTIFPVRLGRLTYETKLSNPSTRVGDASIEFVVEGPNYYSSVDFDDHYLGRPVMSIEPNRIETIDLSFTRFATMFDSQTGLRFLNDDADRAFTSQQYSWLLNGRQAHHEFRQMLYELRGRLHELWLPTYAEDLFLEAPAASGDDTIDVEYAGLLYANVPSPGREHIWIKGYEGAKITSVADATDIERLGLDSELANDIPVGTQISFMDVARLDQDKFEITHHTDTEGTSEAKAVFATINPDRDGTGPNGFPIPESEMTSETCGGVGGGPCVFHFQMKLNNWTSFHSTAFNHYQVEMSYQDEDGSLGTAAASSAFLGPDDWQISTTPPTYVHMNAATGQFDVIIVAPMGNEQSNTNGFRLYLNAETDWPDPADLTCRWRQVSAVNLSSFGGMIFDTIGPWHNVALDSSTTSTSTWVAPLPADVSDSVIGSCTTPWISDFPLSFTFPTPPSCSDIHQDGLLMTLVTNLYARARGHFGIDWAHAGFTWNFDTSEGIWGESNPAIISSGGVTFTASLSIAIGGNLVYTITTDVPAQITRLDADVNMVSIDIRSGASCLSGWTQYTAIDNYGNVMTVEDEPAPEGSNSASIYVHFPQFHGRSTS